MRRTLEYFVKAERKREMETQKELSIVATVNKHPLDYNPKEGESAKRHKLTSFNVDRKKAGNSTG